MITVGSTKRIPLLYRGEYSQWREWFMNYLEEKTDSEAMINSIQNEKKTRKIDSLARSLLIQGLPNDIYSLIDSNKTAKDLWDALERKMRGSEYGEQDRKASILYEYETFKASVGEQFLDTYLCYLQVINDLKKYGYKKDNCKLNYKFLNNLQPKWKQYGTLIWQTKNLMDINIDALYNILKQNQGDVNDALGYKKKAVMITSNPLALVAEKTNSANKKQEFVKSNDKKEDKKADEKKRDMSKVKCYNCKKEGHFAKDCKKAKVKDYNYYRQRDSDKSSSSAKETIAEVSYYTSESESENEFETSEYYDNSTNYGLIVNNDDDQEIFHDAIESKRINKANQQSTDFEIQNKDFQEKYDVLINQVNTFEEQNNEFNEQIKVLNEKNADLLDQTKVLKDQLHVKHVVIDTHVECHEKYAKLEEERYEYMIRYSALFDNDKQPRKRIADQEVLFDKMSIQLVELDKHTVHMIMPYKDNLYNGRKRIGFENLKYFEKAKDLRPCLYDEKVIGLSKQISSLKPYVSNVNLEKIIIDLEDEVVSLLENKKANLKTIESLKSKGFESSENAISESKNQSENDCHEVEKECDKAENPKVIVPGMFKVSVSQSVSPILMSKSSYDSKNVESLGHNLFSVGQFCDNGLEVAFRKSTWFVRNEDGADYLTDDCLSNLYSIDLNEVASNSSTCLLAKVLLHSLGCGINIFHI
nr:hypothetical protein [Tanacetum cinerariifolium]